MSTTQGTIDFILEQTAGAGNVRARKMFGEYALYCDEKVVALVCDNELFVKITGPGKMFVGPDYQEGFAYPGAKASILIPPDKLDDAAWLTELVLITAAALPRPKPKVKKK